MPKIKLEIYNIYNININYINELQNNKKIFF